MRSLLLVLSLVPLGCSGKPPVHRLDFLIWQREEQVEQQRRASERAPEGYAPKVAGRLDELAADAAAMLRQLPGVARVDVLVTCPKPTHRIIQLRDWHFVPRELHAVGGLWDASGKPLSDADVHASY